MRSLLHLLCRRFGHLRLRPLAVDPALAPGLSWAAECACCGAQMHATKLGGPAAR